VCFIMLIAERVLSAIAEFLVHLLGDWAGLKEVEEESGEGSGGYGEAGNGSTLK